tara:strand:- start:212 stop:655 length:444 start_codon:yes stop_codon:yes gene_type:complete
MDMATSDINKHLSCPKRIQEMELLQRLLDYVLLDQMKAELDQYDDLVNPKVSKPIPVGIQRAQQGDKGILYEYYIKNNQQGNRGDCNNDKRNLSILDVFALIKHIMGYRSLPIQSQLNCDMDGDNKLDLNDVRFLVDYIFALESGNV